MLELLKNFVANRLSLDELVTLAAYGRSLRAEYEYHSLDEPSWLDSRLKTLRREIQSRNADELERRKKQIETSLNALKTPAERKKELLKQLEEVNSQLTPTSA